MHFRKTKCSETTKEHGAVEATELMSGKGDSERRMGINGERPASVYISSNYISSCGHKCRDGDWDLKANLKCSPLER